MKLFYSANSPYVRKTMILLHELEMVDQIEFIADYKTSSASAAEKIRHNPLNKVPVLITDDGFSIFDSSVIGQYLDTQHNGPKFYPMEGRVRWETLRNEAIGDGVMDATILVMYEEKRRTLNLFWQEWFDKQEPKLVASLNHFEKVIGPPKAFDAGAISLVCALGLIDFRFDDLNWKEEHPNLAQWYAEVCKRPSVNTTKPRDTA